MRRYILTAIICACCTQLSLAQQLQLTSPNGKAKVWLRLNPQHVAEYAVDFKGQKILKWSGLGFDERKSGEFKNGLKVITTSRSTHDDTFIIIAGKANQSRNHYNELTVQLQENGYWHRKINLVFRAYDDGIALRYVFPTQKLKKFDLIAENTEFNFAGDYTCWVQHIPGFNFNYETGFDKATVSGIYGKPGYSETIIQNINGFGFPAAYFHEKLVGLPLLVQTPDSTVAAIAEADLTNYAGMYLERSEDKFSLHSVLAPLPQGNGTKVIVETPQSSPWRVIMLGEKPGDLISSTLILNLNRPNKIKDPDWIKPGKSAWDFLAGRDIKGVDFKGGMNMQTLKYYIDFASEYHLQYYTIDDGWNPSVVWYKDSPDANVLKPADGIDMPALAAYGASKNVGLFLWCRYDNIRDHMDTIFAGFEKWGIKGVKIDFMDSDDQGTVNFYEKCLATAAKYHLLVNFHGAYKPTGLTRTYPNYITQEGVKGQEWSNTQNKLTPEHNVTLAYTRMLLGPMDYTPGGFNNVTLENHELMKFEITTTRAHQLALLVVFESPLMTISGVPKVYRENPESEFLKQVYSSWDETKVLSGVIGEYIVIARRKGSEWFIGAICDSKGKSLPVPLSFLQPGKKYQVTTYADGPKADTLPTQVVIGNQEVTSAQSITLKLAKAGGEAVYFREIQ